MIFQTTLSLHIAGGVAALAAAGVAMAAAKGAPLHRAAGQVYIVGMFMVSATTLVLVALRPNAFLLAIGLFSVYLVFTGWQAARVRDGRPQALDRIAAAGMLVVGVGMLAGGAAGAAGLTGGGGHEGPVLLVFGAIGTAMGFSDLRALGGAGWPGKARISRHLTRMLAGTIATVTAAAVVNLRFLPDLVVWLGPTVVMTPVIAWWNVRVLSGTGRGARRPVQ